MFTHFFFTPTEKFISYLKLIKERIYFAHRWHWLSVVTFFRHMSIFWTNGQLKNFDCQKLIRIKTYFCVCVCVCFVRLLSSAHWFSISRLYESEFQQKRRSKYHHTVSNLHDWNTFLSYRSYSTIKCSCALILGHPVMFTRRVKSRELCLGTAKTSAVLKSYYFESPQLQNSYYTSQPCNSAKL